MKSVKIFLALALLGLASAEDNPIIDLPSQYDLDDVDQYLDLNLTNTLQFSDCRRTCVAGQSRICYYKFYIEHYQSMGVACRNCSQGNAADCQRPQCVPTDGYEKNIISINRRIPGPHIEVCENDVVIVDVINLLHAETFSMHWHGILQKGTPFSDGVPYVTQCPIQPYTTFRYRFLTPDRGTFFYHSHSGIQRYNGAYGALTVRAPPAADSSTPLFQIDQHSVVLADWSHTAPELFLVGNPSIQPGLLPEGLLINGKGKHMTATINTPTPHEVFYLTPGSRHRFRIVDAGSSVCPMQVQIQNHNMTIISTDGNNVNPVTVDTLVLTTGERFDVVINANQPPGIYWFHAKLIGACTARAIFQTAMLVYGFPATSPPLSLVAPPRASYAGYSQKLTMNDQVVPCRTNSSYLCITDLKSPESPNLLSRTPDLKLYWTFTVKPLNTTTLFARGTYTPFFNIVGYNAFIGTMNDVSLMPPTSPLISQPFDVDYSPFCGDYGTPAHCSQMEVCACTYVNNIPANALVEIVLIDQAPAFSFVIHPIHIHGFKFVVVSEGVFPNPGTANTVALIKQYEAQGLLKGNNTQPPRKDTLPVQNQGYAVIRFIADNPGAWLTHCHVEDHMAFGMGLVLNVAGPLPPVPPRFPTCGNFF